MASEHTSNVSLSDHGDRILCRNAVIGSSFGDSGGKGAFRDPYAGKTTGGTLYQSAVELPVMTGLFVNRVFLPETMNVQEAKYTLAHMECRRARRSNLWNAFYVAALLLHWYDPCVWAAVFLVRRDEQMACDECAVDRCSAADKNAYIQGILNIVPQEKRVPFTACASFETDLERRSQRLLHQGSRPNVL